MSNWFRTYGLAEVHSNLLVGAVPLDADDVGMLRRIGVGAVLNLVQDDEYPAGAREAVVAELADAGIEERRLPRVDFGRLPAPWLEEAVTTVLDWLDSDRRVYLHCRAGWQRSAAVAIGVVALRDGVDIETAFGRVNSRKPSADPLPHQREDLLTWWTDRGAESRPESRPDL